MNHGYAIRQLRSQTMTPNSTNIPSPKQRRTWRHSPPEAGMKRHVQPKPTPSLRKELDGFVLLEATNMAFPEDGRRVNVSGRGFTAVVADDLNFFVNLCFLDASDNLFDFRDFEDMPSLVEMRLSCNYIEHIDSLGPQQYVQLQYLDLSYNRLSVESVQALSALPALRDLDLTGNELRTLPEGASSFLSLEKLVLEHNKLDDNNIFFELCQMPSLREACLAYNLLSYLPSQACQEGYFKVMELLDMSYNYVASQSAIEPALQCPRLLQLLVYGNPLLGSSGEDSTGVYVEEMLDSAMLARDGSPLPPLDIVTEAPKKRTLRKGGFTAGRHSMYTAVSIEQVDSEQQTLHKTARQYKMEGNKTLFAQAVDVARRNNNGGGINSQSVDFDDSTASGPGFFLTSVQSGADPRRKGGGARNDRVADEVMTEIAANMHLGNTADVKQLRSQMGAKYREGQPQDPAERVPHDLFSRSMTHADTLQTYPVSLNTAIKSLRYAIQHPLTNHDEIPASSLFPPKHYIQKTALSEGRQLKRLDKGQPVVITDLEEKVRSNRRRKNEAEAAAKALLKGDPPAKKQAQTSKQMRAPSTSESERHAKDRDTAAHTRTRSPKKPFLETVNDKKKLYRVDKRRHNSAALTATMQQIDDVLDELNLNTLAISRRQGGTGGSVHSHSQTVADTAGTVTGVAGGFRTRVERPTTGVKGLIDMVNSVVDELVK